MHQIEVSHYNNNSGLYALALAISFKIQDQTASPSVIQSFISSIAPSDLVHTVEITEVQQQLAQVLRGNLAIALLEDSNFKDASFERFVNLCLYIHKRIPDDMYCLIHSNIEFVFNLNSTVQQISRKQIKKYDDAGVELDEQSYAIAEVRKSWDQIYNNYANYFIDQENVRFSARELNCLASKLGMQLPIISPIDSANANAERESLYVIKNENGHDWYVVTAESTLKPASEHDNDRFMTLCLLDEALQEVLRNKPSHLDPSRQSNLEGSRQTQQTFITRSNELIFRPKNTRSSSANGLLQNKEFDKDVSVGKNLVFQRILR